MFKDIDDIRFAGIELLESLSFTYHINLGFDYPTIVWLDDYIAINRNIWSDEQKKALSYSVGYILGEAVIKNFHGTWTFDNDFKQWVVSMGFGNVNPIGKANKYLYDYLDSIESFYTIVGMADKNGGFDFDNKKGS